MLTATLIAAAATSLALALAEPAVAPPANAPIRILVRAADGAPVAGLEITFILADDNPERPFRAVWAETDASGEVRFDWDPARIGRVFTAEPTWGLGQRLDEQTRSRRRQVFSTTFTTNALPPHAIYEVPAAVTDPLVTIDLRPGVTISGRIVDAQGVPVKRATINDRHRAFSVQSLDPVSNQLRFVLRGIPRGQTAQLVVATGSSNRALQPIPGDQLNQNIDLGDIPAPIEPARTSKVKLRLENHAEALPNPFSDPFSELGYAITLISADGQRFSGFVLGPGGRPIAEDRDGFVRVPSGTYYVLLGVGLRRPQLGFLDAIRNNDQAVLAGVPTIGGPGAPTELTIDARALHDLMLTRFPYPRVQVGSAAAGPIAPTGPTGPIGP
ncbi:MAG: hypothetical protein IBJ11_11850 [Phycisphaerales bacterium]|nr:hypothetical protein [Phycisphaerales bacterium]